jgi:hypothetical protein
VTGIPSSIQLDPPTDPISVDWGTPPTLSCVVTVNCGSGGSGGSGGAGVRNLAAAPAAKDSFDSFVEVEATDLGIPSEIKVTVPKMPDIRLVHELPMEIKLVSPSIPDIHILGPATPLPTKIEIVNKTNIPNVISLVSYNVPSSIRLDSSSLPSAIKLEVPTNFPTSIFLDASGIPKTIQVVGIPDSIELKGNIPSEIKITAPENLEVPLVYKGGPIPLQFDMKSLKGESGEDMPCFAIVPCPKK